MTFKDTQVGKIPAHWGVDTMENVLEKIIDYRGKTPKKSETGIKTLSAKSVKNGFIDYSLTYFISEETYNKFMVRGYPQIGDILLTTEAPLGNVAKLDRDDVAVAQRLLTLRGKENVLYNDYLRYYLMSNMGRHQLLSRETGTTVTGIKQKEFRKALIPLPPISEQKTIGDTLSKLDEKVLINNRISEKLDVIVKTLFKSWFIDYDFPNTNNEPYYSSGGGMVDSEVGLIPEGWNVLKLEDILKIKHGYAFKSKNFSDEETNLYILTPGNFRIGGGFKSDKFKFLEQDVVFPDEYILEEDDLIVTMTDLSRDGDTLGYPALVPGGEVHYLHNQRIGKVQLKTEFSKLFLYNLMCSPNYRGHILGGATGTTVKHTAPKRIEAYKFACPNNELLDKFEEFSSPIVEKIKCINRENQALINIRNTLLPKLISGSLQVNEIH